MPSSRKPLKAAPAPAGLRRLQEQKSPFRSGRGGVTLSLVFFTSGAQQLPRYEKKTMQKLIFSHARPKKAQIKTSPPGAPGGEILLMGRSGTDPGPGLHLISDPEVAPKASCVRSMSIPLGIGWLLLLWLRHSADCLIHRM